MFTSFRSPVLRTTLRYTVGITKIPSSLRGFSSQPEQERIYDALIVGAGAPGTSLACKLAQIPNARIGIIDANTPPTLGSVQNREDIDLRVFAINPASQKFLQSIGAWDYIEQTRHAPYRNMQVWDASSFGTVRFSGGQMHDDTLGSIVENRVLLAALHHRALEMQSTNSLTCHFGEKIESIDLPPEDRDPKLDEIYGDTTKDIEAASFPQVKLSDGTVLNARLLVGADGPQSIVRNSADIGTSGWDYDQRAVVANIQINRESDTAYQRFLPLGPVAMLPLWNSYSSIVWSTTNQHARYLEKCSEDDFINQLNRSFRLEPEKRGDSRVYDIMHDVLLRTDSFFRKFAETSNIATLQTSVSESPPVALKLSGPRASFPLRMAHANRYTRRGVVLVGDAAHTVHPLAGQGLNIGLQDSESLGAILTEAENRGGSWSSPHLLKKYEQERELPNTVMMTVIDGLKRLFVDNDALIQSSNPLVHASGYAIRGLRGIGMTAINYFPPLKKTINDFARGDFFNSK